MDLPLVKLYFNRTIFMRGLYRYIGNKTFDLRQKALLTILCFLWSGSQSFSQTQWTWLNPSLPAYTFNDVKCLDSSTVVIVGNSGTILRSTDAGESWKSVHNPTSNNLLAISFSDRDHGIVVGDSGTLLFTTNGGIDWTRQTSGTNLPLRSVSFADSLNGLIVGGSYFDGMILKTTNRGASWTAITGYSYYQLNSVGYTSPMDVLIAAQSGDVYKSTDGGSVWNYLYSTSGQPLYSIYCLQNNTAVAVGYDIMRITISGITLTTPIGNGGFPKLGIWLTDSGLGFAVGSGVNTGPTGLILKTTDFGSTWSEIVSGTVAGLHAVSFWGTTLGFIVGEGGVILRTIDGGTTWINLQRSFTSLDFSCVKVLNADSALVFGTGGAILRTTDRGKTWNSCSSGTTNTILSVFFSEKKIGTAVGVGGTIIHSTDAGHSWSVQSSNTTVTLGHVHFTSVISGYAVGSDGTILHTTDEGTTWLPQSSGTNEPLGGISFYDDTHGIAVGGSGPYGGGSVILQTTNGGIIWTRVPSSPGIVHALRDVVYLDSNTVVALGSYEYVVNHSDIIRSSDGGASWDVVAGFFSSQTLEGLSFPDRINGYAVASGSVLRSTNAGSTWNTSLGVEQNLNALSFYDSLNGMVVGSSGLILRATKGSLTNVETLIDGLPKQSFLYQNYPNPFNPITTIRFQIPHSSFITLKVFDMLGREIATLVDEEMKSGSYVRTFDGSRLASGVYFYQLRDRNLVQTKKLLLLK